MIGTVQIETGDAQHRVALAISGRQLSWSATSGTVLECLENAGVEVRSSCRMGTCGSGEIRILGGTVAYDPEPFIEAAGGAIFICCSRPESDIILEL